MIRNIHKMLPWQVSNNSISHGFLLAFALLCSCGEDESPFQRKPEVNAISTEKGVTTTFFLAPSANQNANLDLNDLAATRFKKTDQVFYDFQVRNGTSAAVTCNVLVAHGSWFKTVNMTLQRNNITVASYAPFPDLIGIPEDSPFYMQSVTLPAGDTAILNIGLHQWPDAIEKNIRLSEGKYKATASISPFCSESNPQTFEINFEIIAD